MDPEEPTVENDDVAAGHTWRHVRTAATLLVLVVFVIGAAWYSWNQVTSEDDDTDARANATCVPVAPTDAPPRDKIEVNVYNSTQRGGLAKEVAGKLGDRGFIIMDVANDPQESTVEGTAEVRTHPDQQKAAGLVAAMVPNAVVVTDERSSKTIDLVLGEKFKKLAAEPDPNKTQDPCS